VTRKHRFTYGLLGATPQEMATFTTTAVKISNSLTNIVIHVYSNTPNYWVSGLCPSSGILNTKKQNVSETRSVSVLR
jgi:hypothetical protein